MVPLLSTIAKPSAIDMHEYSLMHEPPWLGAHTVSPVKPSCRQTERPSLSTTSPTRVLPTEACISHVPWPANACVCQ